MAVATVSPTIGRFAPASLRSLVVGAGFAFAVGLRVAELRHHPIVDLYGTVAAVVVTPTRKARAHWAVAG